MRTNRNHLQCINGHYRYRRRWPKALRSVAKGEFFIRHLGTASLEEAMRLRPTAELEYFAEVDRLKRLVDSGPREISQAEATMLVSRWFAEQARSDADYDLNNPSRDPDEHRRAMEGKHLMAEVISDMLGSGQYEEFEGHTAELFEEQGIMPDRRSPGFRLAVQLMARADKERWNLSAARLRGDYGYQPADPVFAKSLLTDPSKGTAPTLGRLIEAFKSDRAGGWSPSTTAAYAPVERVMREVLGSARQLDTIERADGRKLYDIVRQLPRGIGKSPKLKGLSIAQAIQTDLPKLSPKSVNGTYLAMMKATFRFAVQEQWMAVDPLAGLSVVDPVAEADKRDPFTIEQLNQIFAACPWRPKDDSPRGRPLNYWGPLIALFLGMRRGEIAQLRTDEVAVVEGIPVFLIRASDGRRLKTVNARRMLPVHPELQRLGFLTYVEGQRSAGNVQLWPGERADSRGKWGDSFSDWFQRLLAARGIKGKKLGLHSFRHNFQDRLREAGLHGTALGQELAGRSKGGSTSNNYGSGFPTSALADAIARINYPGLRLP